MQTIDISNILKKLTFKDDIKSLGGKIYIVGGTVRDLYFNKPSKDLDIVICGVPLDTLMITLKKYGRCDLVGESFGVIKLKIFGTDEDIDIALPRTEKSNGEIGHKAFDIISDHKLPIEDDLYRRDFTINSIAIDMDGNVVDPFDGVRDIENRILRATNPDAFSDDPLRMLRGCGFMCRLGLIPSNETQKMIMENAPKIKGITYERILIEFKKMVEKGSPEHALSILLYTNLYENIFDKKYHYNINFMLGCINTFGEFMYVLIDGINVEHPDIYFKEVMKGDIETAKEIKCLSIITPNVDIFGNSKISEYESRWLLNKVYKIAPHMIDSWIVKNTFKDTKYGFTSGKYPISFKELAIGGDDLIEMGIYGKHIGEALNGIMDAIYKDKIENNKESIIKFLENNEQ